MYDTEAYCDLKSSQSDADRRNSIYAKLIELSDILAFKERADGSTVGVLTLRMNENNVRFFSGYDLGRWSVRTDVSLSDAVYVLDSGTSSAALNLEFSE